MSLAAGAKLGPYEILAPIGAGGMGEVYRAKDTKLDREVAIKILPESVANDPDRLARFEREAKVLAALNHPNIAQIYGVEQRALVMELVEGESLKGPLPIETALDYARQIAEALEAAHEKSIVHRDLKPANVKVTPEGVVKVLDFGLAMAVDGPAPTSDANISPTVTMRATQAGMIMGTAAYMSPEQARAQAVDRRADIWAFGAVLFEMLSGRPAFHGETVTDILASVVKLEPDWSALPPSTPPAIVRLMQRCLKKDRKQRLQAIGDARITIEEYLADPTSGREGLQPTETRRTAWLPWAIGVAALAFIGIAGWAAWWRATRVVDHDLKPLVRLDVDLGPDVSLGSQAGADVIISPDGNRLVYVSRSHLVTRRLNQSAATELAGTEGAYAPFFSPDGRWVGFFAQGKLKKISADGGPAVTLTGVSGNAFGGSWGEDGNIVVSPQVGPLIQVPDSGGKPVPITQLDQARGEVSHRWPQLLPGGKAVLFSASATTTSIGGGSIEVFSLIDHRNRTLMRTGSYPRYLSSGHLVYLSAGTLFAVPFDLDRLEVRGTPVPVLGEVAYSALFGTSQFDFSLSGTLVYRTGTETGRTTIQWLDGAGKTLPLLAKPGLYLYPQLSPDGNRLAIFANEGSESGVWIYQWQRDTMTRLTSDSYNQPLWSPDGRYIAMRAVAGGIYWTRADGAGKPQPLTQSKSVQYPWSFTADGRRLAFNQVSFDTGYDIWTVSLEKDEAGLRANAPEPFLRTMDDERHPAFSPDGRWLAYSSNESGTFQVYVKAFPDKGGRLQVSNNGGLYPHWSRNGRELFFRTEDNRIMVVIYTTKGDSFAGGKPQPWSNKQLANVGITRNYDLAPDGKHIAALMPAEAPEDKKATNHVTFLLNFFDELRRRVPVSK